MNRPEAPSLGLNLSLCEREPIHIPGAIQPHGAVLAALTGSLLVTHASANLAAISGRPAEDVLGQPLADIIGKVALHELMGSSLLAEAVLGQVQSLSGPDDGSFRLQAHRSGRHICMDIEPIRPEPWQRPSLTTVQSTLQTFKDADTPTELCELAVSGVAMITGYDRVMAYRFADDGHGEVIAESCGTQFEPYFGLHYPATDIPPQARRQYLSQRVGVIADSNYQPVPLLADLALHDGEPLDLTYSALRSVSPIHRAYMRNMGTTASLTIGLAHEQKLWGMLVCHHHTTPRVAGPELRAIADIIGQVVSLLIGSLGDKVMSTQRLRRSTILHTLTQRLTAPVPMTDTFVAMEAELLHLVDATGAIIHFADTLVCLGRIPEQPVAEQALSVLHPGPGGDMVAVEDLGLRHPGLAGCIRDGSGALMLPLGEGANDAILWFRPEQTQTVTWAGNPNEHSTLDTVTGNISPRASFSAWKEVMRGRSVSWNAADLALADALRRAVEVEVARRTRMVIYLSDHLFASSPNAMVRIGRAGQIRMINGRAETLFGYDDAELKNKPFEILMPERFCAWLVAQRQRLLAETTLSTMADGTDLFGLRKDGTEFPLEIRLDSINSVDLAGEPMVQASISDLTVPREIERVKREIEEKEQTRRELERSNADLEEFSYAVSHDLKAPLRAIGNLARWIDENLRATAQLETLDNIRLLQERVVRMQKLLDGLLEYSRLGQTSKLIEEVDLASVVQDIIAMLVPAPGFVVNYVGEARTIRTQRVAIQMVLANLISNGLKHHDRVEGRIVVSMRMIGGLAEVRVGDDGPGIPSQFHQRIFTIFQTLKSRDDIESSGIGLAIVKRKVETHGGRIWIESSPPIRGTTFCFTWNEAAP